MIVGGTVSDGSAPELTEVVALGKTNSTPSFGQLPETIWGAVGTMFGNVPIICGGAYFDSIDSNLCISFQNSQWVPSHGMIEHRSSLAGVQINLLGNIPAFWLLGGISAEIVLDSTEIIFQGDTNRYSGPNLPYKMFGMCAIKLSDDEIFVIGGGDEDYNDRNEVWIYNPQNDFARKQGPSLNIARQGHSCSTMRDGEKTFIVVVDGFRGSGSADSVEIYDPTDKTWHFGKSNS